MADGQRILGFPVINIVPQAQPMAADAAGHRAGARPHRIIDLEGSEVFSSTLDKAKPDPAKKSNTWCFILHIHEIFAKLFGVTEMNHVHKMWEVTAVIYTCHVRARQRYSHGGRFIEKTDGLGFLHANGYSAPVKELTQIFEALLLVYDLKYGSDDAGMNNTGTVTSILTWIALSKPRFSEVKFGNTRVVYKKYHGREDDDGNPLPNEDDIEIRSMGYTPAHQVFFGGSTFNPVMQSAMRQSLGPLLVLYNLGRATDPKIRKTWMKTATEMFGLVDGHDRILNTIASMGNGNVTLNRAMGDLCMLGVARVGNKASFPSALILTVARKNAAYEQLFGLNYDPSLQLRITPAHIHDAIKNIDLSGVGLQRFYFHAQQSTYKMYSKGPECVRYYPQLLFHSIFGTHRDDLGIYEFLTGDTAYNRATMGQGLTGTVNKEVSVDVKLPIVTKGTKLASASQTGLLKGGRGQVISFPVVSGKTTQRIAHLRDCFAHLNEDNQLSRMPTNADAGQVTNEVRTIVNNLVKKVTRDGALTRGTKPFYHITNVGGVFGVGNEITEPLELTGRYFYGNEEPI